MPKFLRRLVSEAHRRSLWQVLGVYIVGSSAGWQVIVEITDRVGLPDWVPGFALVLFIIGLPIVIGTAFVQEGSPLSKPAAPRPLFEPSDPTLLPMDTVEVQPERRHHWILTWPKALAGGAFAFLLLGLTAGGYMGLRNAGVGPFGSLLASGAIEHRERIIIADFHTASGDTSLAQAITEAFRVDFAQTPTVTVVEPAHVRLVLQRMSHDIKARLDADLARDVAIRDNIKVLIAGDISAAGGKYVVAAKLVNTKDANVLASYRETAADSTEILDAVDKLSKKLREKLGESLKTIRSEKPLEAVSTPSLEALLKYTQANYALDTEQNYELAISLLEEALAIDSTFGMAWRKLAVAYGNAGVGGREKVVHAATRAYEYRDRMTDTEKYHATGYYFYAIKSDWQKAISAYELLVDRDPNFPPNNLGLAYLQIRELEKAAAAFREAVRRDSTLAVGYTNLFDVLRRLEQLDEAEKVLAAFTRRFPDRSASDLRVSDLAMARGDFDAAEATVRAALKAGRGTARERASTRYALAAYAQLRGRLAEADRLADEWVATQVERGNVWAPLNRALARADISRHIRLDPERSRRELAAALAEFELEDIPVLNRPYLWIAWQYALLGEGDKARAYLAEFERNVPPDLRGPERQYRSNADALRAVAGNRVEEAIAIARREFDTVPCEPCWAFDQAFGFELVSRPDSAIFYYEKALSYPAWDRGNIAWNRPRAHESLADLYESQGTREKAAYHAAQFVSLWENADSELQPRVRAKRALLQRLSPDK